MEVLSCSTQWGWTESDNILGKAALLLKAQNFVANSSGVAAKGLPWLCKCSEATLQCTTHSFCSVNCQHEYLTNLPTGGIQIFMTVYYVVVSCNTYPCISQQNQNKMPKFQKQWKFTINHLNTTSYCFKWLQIFNTCKNKVSQRYYSRYMSKKKTGKYHFFGVGDCVLCRLPRRPQILIFYLYMAWFTW